jgi:hypothetical protein
LGFFFSSFCNSPVLRIGIAPGTGGVSPARAIGTPAAMGEVVKPDGGLAVVVVEVVAVVVVEVVAVVGLGGTGLGTGRGSGRSEYAPPAKGDAGTGPS